MHAGGELTADSEPRLARSDEHVLGYCETALSAVDHRLVELIREPEGSSSRSSRGGIWCAAQALDASAMAWQRLDPSVGRSPGALVSRLEGQMAEGPLPVLSTAAVAAKCQIAGAALDRLALSLGLQTRRFEPWRTRSSTLRPWGSRFGQIRGRDVEREASLTAR